MKFLNFPIYLIALFFLLACHEEKHEPLFSGETPNAISQYTIENQPGAAVIHFELDDPRTKYVKAVYTVREGLSREIRVSKFDNKLRVDGFGASQEYSIALYALGKDEQASEPTYVTVHPDQPPFQTVANELVANADWGGGKVSGPNPTSSKLMIGVLRKDENGEWQDVDVFFTENQSFNFNFRGFDPVETMFGIYTRDQWQNYSDTVEFAFTPWEEIRIPLTNQNFNNISMPGDAVHRNNYTISRLFDGLTDSWTNGFYTEDEPTWPKTITFDLGNTYQLSRFKLFQNSNVYYRSANIKHLRIYGNTSLDENYENWTLLGEWDNWRPSQRPPTEIELTEDDQIAALAGNDFDFPLEIPGVRYLRFEVVTTWEPRISWYATELQFWGRPTNE